MARYTKPLKIIINIIYLMILIYIIVKKPHVTVSIKRIERFLADLKHILIWKNIYGLVGWVGDGQEYFINHKCGHINCYITTNRTLFGDLRYFDAVLFNLQDLKEEETLPQHRGLYQKYVFAANDSSDNYPVCDPIYDDFFNWTWTYRSDSIIPYRFITIHNTNYDILGSPSRWISNMKPIDNILKSQFVTKSKAAAIFLDKCESRSHREIIWQKLQKYLAPYNLTIDVFGECGKKCKRRTMAPCFWRLKKHYYFYLAFEDSLAYDYVTDLVLYAYKNNAVPIVYGKAQYERFLPPGSYLNTQNVTLKTLAKKMHAIIVNREQYFDFFRWKNHYLISKSRGLDACDLCEHLNNPVWLVHKISYGQFRKWWNPKYEERCKTSKYWML